MKKILFVFLLNCLVFIGMADARLIPFQGRVTDSENRAINGVYTIIFSIYEAPTGGTAIWSESHSSVSIIQGYVNVLLGAINTIELPDASDDTTVIDFSAPKYIGIKIGSTGREMLPRHQIVPSFHSQMADKAGEAFNARNADLFGGRPPSDYADSGVTQALIKKLQSDMQGMQTKITEVEKKFDASNDAFKNLVAPVGSIVWFTGTNIPEGWIKCDGRILSRVGEYAALWKHAEASGNLEDNSVWQNEKKGGFGYGDGTATFTIPDLRGEFIRAWTDGSTVDIDRQLGSNQTDAGRNVYGYIGSRYGDGAGASGAFVATSHNHAGTHRGGGFLNASYKFDASRVWGEDHTTGQRVDGTDLPDPNPEFRPRNVPMIPIIKYK